MNYSLSVTLSHSFPDVVPVKWAAKLILGQSYEIGSIEVVPMAGIYVAYCHGAGANLPRVDAPTPREAAEQAFRQWVELVGGG